MTKHDWKVGDRARIVSVRDLATMRTNFNWRGKIGDVNRISGNEIGIYREEEHDWWWFHRDDLEPIPAEAPKDPFAPGEYVTCVVAEGFHGKDKGDVLLVDGYTHPDKDWFCSLGWSCAAGRMETLGFPKRCFRPATPEEIAAYKEKYEAEPVVDPQPEPEPRITFTVGGQEFYVGQRVWSLTRFRDVKNGQELRAIGTHDNSLCVHALGSVIIYRFSLSNISTTPPTPHEWKRGDWARHESGRECFVCGAARLHGVDGPVSLMVSFKGEAITNIPASEFTFIKHIDLPS